MDKILKPKVSVSRAVSRDKTYSSDADRAVFRTGRRRSCLPECAATPSGSAELAPAVNVGASFTSILFIYPPEVIGSAVVPVCFRDLNLDQVVDAIITGREEYNLRPYFHISLTSLDEITYRHEVMQDLEYGELRRHIQDFAASTRAMREQIATAIKMRYQYQKEGWFLEAVDTYCSGVVTLDKDLAHSRIRSLGLVAFRDYVRKYVQTTEFKSLHETAHRLKDNLAAVRYNVLINGGGFKVRRYDMEADYSAKIEKTFAKFRQGSVKDYASKLLDGPEMNHVEAKILDFVAMLYHDVFSRLNTFFDEQNGKFVDAKIANFDREIQFYLAYREYIAPLQDCGLKFCYPKISGQSKEVDASASFDIALASKLATEKSTIVTNDFHLAGEERILVVSGPNQGGKTTFARTFGQMHYLASIGCPVPGRKARLYLADRILTHFEREEDIKNLRGKLQDDLVRIHEILGQATADSIVIMNEIFTSTTLRDATFLSGKIMERIISLDALCVWVTFIHELASFSGQTVSMVSQVEPDSRTTRTYKVIRAPAAGRSYAASIAEKYGLAPERLKERLGS